MHVNGPFRAIFDQIGQFPEQVRTTQGVTALLEIKVTGPAVVHRPVFEVLEQGRFRFERLLAALVVDEQVGETCGGGGVEPLEFLLHPHTRLVEMGSLGCQNGRLFLLPALSTSNGSGLHLLSSGRWWGLPASDRDGATGHVAQSRPLCLPGFYAGEVPDEVGKNSG